MNNPFSYGGVVFGEMFCNRTREQEELVRAAVNGERLFIHGERRVGKTSLLKSVMRTLALQKAVCFYIDVWKCIDEEDFQKACSSALTEYLVEESHGVTAKLAEFFSGIAPAISVDDSGKPTFTLVRSRTQPQAPELETLLRCPARVKEKNPGKTVLVVFDEFQQVREISGMKLERIIRSIVQEQTGVAWFFCGSRSTLLREMFTRKGNPLYQSSGHYPVESITKQHWHSFITREFTGSGRTITEEAVAGIFSITDGHPFYTQMLCSALWDISGRDATDSDLGKAVTLLLDRERGTYTTLWNSLPEQPRRMMRALALEGTITKPTSGDFVRRYGFASASSAKSALIYLLKKDYTVRDSKGGYCLVDRFLSLWCRTNLVP